VASPEVENLVRMVAIGESGLIIGELLFTFIYTQSQLGEVFT